MFPAIMAGLEAGGGILDSIMGSNEANKQYKLAKKQYNLMKDLALAGQNTGRGVQVYWDPKGGPYGRGEWVTKYTDIGQQIQDTTNATDLQRLLEQSVLAAGRSKNRAQRDDMRPIIDTMIAKLQNQTDLTPAALEGDLNAVTNRALNETYNKASGAIARTAMRTPGAFGARANANPVSGLAQDRATAMAENRLKALSGADEINAQRRGNTINQLNALASQAFNLDDVPYAPPQLTALGAQISAARPGQASNLLSYGLQGLQNSPNSPFPYGDVLGGLNSISQTLSGSGGGSNPVGPANPMGLGGKRQSQHNEFLRNYNYDRQGAF